MIYKNTNTQKKKKKHIKGKKGEGREETKKEKTMNIILQCINGKEQLLFESFKFGLCLKIFKDSKVF